MHYVHVALHVTEVDMLVQMGFLKEKDRQDPERLQGGVMGLIYWVLENPAIMARRRGRAQALRVTPTRPTASTPFEIGGQTYPPLPVPSTRRPPGRIIVGPEPVILRSCTSFPPLQKCP